MESQQIHDDHHHQQQQHQIAGTPPPPLPHHAWTTPNSSILRSNVSFGLSTGTDVIAEILNLRNQRLQNHHENNNNNNLVSSLRINPCIMSNIKDFGLDQWDGGGGGIHHHHHQHQSNGHDDDEFIKQESLYQTGGAGGACYSNYAKELREVDELNVKLLLKSLSCGGGGESSIINGGGGGGNNNNNIQSPSNLEECCSSSLISSSPRNKQSSSSCCSQIYPSINVSELLGGQNISMGDSGGFGMDLQALDLFNNSAAAAAARFGATFRPPPPFHQEHQHGGGGGGLFFKNISGGCFPNYGLDFMHQSSLECTLDSGANVEVHNKRIEKHEEAKGKPGSKTQVGSKRSRLESRACPPFKVRKEKLGDRIAALQQLVSPYGKTDTASVLMEAIGYIKFLQNQVETLSVPYLKSSRHKNNTAPVTLTHGGYGDNKSEERKQDLKSRGLCLVPVSCLSYVTDSNGAMWPL